MYSLYLYFLGLSLQNTSKALTIFKDEKKKLRVCMELDSEVCRISDLQKKKNLCFHNR